MFGAHQKDFPDVPMGSYPTFRDNRPMTQLVLRSVDPDRLGAAAEGLREKLRAKGYL